MPPKKSKSGSSKGASRSKASVEKSPPSIHHPQNLPAEVLSRIFSILADIDIPDQRSKSLGWVTVTHTCERWRSIALEHHSLWATLYGAYPKLWHTFLQRAHGAPLTIVDKDGDASQAASSKLGMPVLTLSVLHSHGAFMKHVTLSSVTTAALTISSFLSREGVSYPLLRTLSIACQAASHTSPPSNFLSNHASNLHTLDLSGMDIFWNFHAPHIRTLRLVLPPGDISASSPTTLEDILQTLSTMKDLERLTLRNVIPAFTQKITIPTTINFPRLHVLELEGPPDSCAELLSILPLRSDAVLSLNCSRWTMSAPAFATILSVFKSRFTVADASRYTDLKLGRLPHGKHGISLKLDAKRFPDCHVPVIQVEIAFPPQASIVSQILASPANFAEFINLIPRRALSSLEIEGYGTVDLRAFKNAVELKDLHIVGGADEDIPSALLPEWVCDDDGEERHEVLFPKLDTLKISGAGMGCGCCASGPGDDSPFLYWWNTMIDQRPKAGYGPRLLVIEDCSANWMSDMVRDWKKQVQTVVWDGKDGSEEDDDAGY